MRRALPVLLMGLLGALPARADILLDGFQHIGDDEDASLGHTPLDPVTRAQMQSFPSRFHLSQSATITAVRFDNAVDLDNHIPTVFIDGVARAGVLIGNVYTLLLPLVLGSGVHTLAPDPGCLQSADLGGACPGISENDISFSSLTLLSASGTTSRALTRRRHLGDDNEAQNDNYGGDYYPDLLEAPPGDVRADIAFNLGSGRLLSTVQFYRLRGVNTPADGHASVLVDGQFIGELTASGDPFAIATGFYLDAGAHTISVIAGTLGPGNRDSMSWDDTLLLFTVPVAGTPGRFNAVDGGGNAVNGVIQTKIAGTAFVLDIVALNLPRNAQLADYAGTVSVQLLDASNDTGPLDVYGCRSSWTTVAALGSLTYTALNGGRRSLNVTHNGVLRNARIRVTDAVAGVSGCSTDAFAIRPDRLEIRASDGGTAIPGDAVTLHNTTTTGVARHQAGQPFTLRVRPLTSGGAAIVGGYARSPGVSATAAVAPATTVGALTLGNWNTVQDASGWVRNDEARYREVGAVTLRAEDADFAAVDAADGSTVTQRTITAGTVNAGRFIPDHYRLVSRSTPSFTPGCGTFTYVGQTFVYAAAPVADLEAVASDGTRLVNYAGALFKLATGPSPAQIETVYTGPVGAPSLETSGLPNPGVTALGSGLARITWGSGTGLRFTRGTQIAPFDAEIQLTADDGVGADGIVDLDGMIYADPDSTDNPLRFGGTAAGTGIAFTGSGKQQRYGRWFLRNAYGPEQLPLDVSFGTEYATGAGTAGFARNLADGCTTATAPALTGGIAASTSVLSTTSPLIAGQGTVRLAAPNQVGNVTLNLSGASWLGGAVEATATFGQFRQSEQRIYQRETFR